MRVLAKSQYVLVAPQKSNRSKCLHCFLDKRLLAKSNFSGIPNSVRPTGRDPLDTFSGSTDLLRLLGDSGPSTITHL